MKEKLSGDSGSVYWEKVVDVRAIKAVGWQEPGGSDGARLLGVFIISGSVQSKPKLSLSGNQCSRSQELKVWLLEQTTCAQSQPSALIRCETSQAGGVTPLTSVSHLWKRKKNTHKTNFRELFFRTKLDICKPLRTMSDAWKYPVTLGSVFFLHKLRICLEIYRGCPLLRKMYAHFREGKNY